LVPSSLGQNNLRSWLGCSRRRERSAQDAELVAKELICDVDIVQFIIPEIKMSQRASLLSAMEYESYPDTPILKGNEQNYYVSNVEESASAGALGGIENPYASEITNPNRLEPTVELTSAVDVSGVQDPFADEKVGQFADQDGLSPLIIYLFIGIILYKLF
jgi:hypothetical protein